jgi:uncharacterized protein YjiS (DUF1127 family)
MLIWSSLREALRRHTADWLRPERSNFANMPDELLYDIGMSREGVPSLARQLRAQQEP